jgi:C1A family cysteine protease
MPIRMVDDDPNQEGNYQDDNNNDYNEGRGSDQASGGGGFGGALLLVPVLGWLLKRPKLLLLAAVLAAAYFFIVKPMLSSQSAETGGGGQVSQIDESKPMPTTGAQFDPKKYDSTEVFEPLDASGVAIPLPDHASLERFAPRRMNQGEQGSCVAWSAAYAARTIMEASSTGVEPNSIAFSPSYLYNQIHLPNCQGSLLPDAMKVMMYKGSLPLKMFPYDENTCERLPNGQAHTFAQNYKMRGFQRLTVDDGDKRVELNAIKQNLAAGAPVVIGMMVPRSFMQGMYGEKVWHPGRNDNPEQTMGGHAMCVIGYDDNLEGGAFQIMNSWGNDWGQNGIGWVRYRDFANFNKEAYGLYPMPKRDAALQRKFACAIGMIMPDRKFIPIRSVGNGEFESTVKVPKGTKFKMYVKNEEECYTYVFGAETNGSSYVLFPYTAKHSPFCGITGVRLFPRNQSLMVDQAGVKDYMAVVVTKKPIDYNAVNRRINATSGASYAAKVKGALASIAIPNVQFASDGNAMQFSTIAPADNKAVVCVVGINK